MVNPLKFLQRGATDAGKNYIAQPKDNTLPSLLHEAFKLLEIRFANYDADGAHTLMYLELERELSLVGFMDHDQLQVLFKRVDLDGNGTLDFSEFLCLLYLWIGKGDYSAFFRHPTNSKTVAKAFSVMERAMVKYDTDKSQTLSIQELDAFFSDYFPIAVQSGCYKEVVEVVYPVHVRQTGKELSFSRFMYLLYDVMYKYPGSTLAGTYGRTVAKAVGGGTGEQSQLWVELKEAFTTLDEDFCRFDANGDRLVDYTEITNGIPVTRAGYDKVDILSRLQYAYSQVDLDKSGTLDFYEFMYLTFMMTQNGAYHDLVTESKGSRMVKRCFINIHQHYRKYDTDHNLRLTYDELEIFCKALFGVIPDILPAAFAQCCYKSSATQGREAVDVVRFMKLLYIIVCPDGQFTPSKYDPQKKAVDPNRNIVSMHVARPTVRPKRIANILPSHFVKEKLLGQGGQGTVHLGKYDGFRCAGKTLLGVPTDDTVKETVDEVNFFLKLDHPNCHYLLGAKTTLDNGGIMLLTEICEKGSIFDFYGKGGKRFDMQTAWRLARECAMGFAVIHDLGFMHRDIKSLNVFLDADLVAKVADFGMCTPDKTADDACGTPQWMAPEVVANVLGISTKYDRRVDVYSYGILLWELFHCQTPYAETRLDQMGICKHVYNNNIRPKMGRSCPPSIQQIAIACWDKKPTMRPTFKAVIANLDSVASTCGIRDLSGFPPAPR
mmetsp:Transcript_63233/g.144825  ORF Transcript_63233/g.144825 Transcript_63233/m.144825 type:complete len:720 (-) Transcript_63233:37-2196(-)